MLSESVSNDPHHGLEIIGFSPLSCHDPLHVQDVGGTLSRMPLEEIMVDPWFQLFIHGCDDLNTMFDHLFASQQVRVLFGTDFLHVSGIGIHPQNCSATRWYAISGQQPGRLKAHVHKLLALTVQVGLVIHTVALVKTFKIVDD